MTCPDYLCYNSHMIRNSNKLEQAKKLSQNVNFANLCFFMSVDTVIMGGNMKGPEENIGDGREQCHARVAKVLGILQFVLAVAVICATRVAEV